MSRSRFWFYCPSGGFISELWLRDGLPDCPNGEDEKYQVQVQPPQEQQQVDPSTVSARFIYEGEGLISD